jgi:hypothetical protein
MLGITKSQQLNKNSIKFKKDIKTNISTKIGTRKKECRKQIHLFIRMRDVRLRGDGYQAPCCTCGKSVGVPDGQAGHYKHGILDDERNIHLQCGECNTYKHGSLDNYYVFMVNLFGKETAEYYRTLNKPLDKRKWYELYELEQKYKAKIKEMESMTLEQFRNTYKYE